MITSHYPRVKGLTPLLLVFGASKALKMWANSFRCYMVYVLQDDVQCILAISHIRCCTVFCSTAETVKHLRKLPKKSRNPIYGICPHIDEREIDIKSKRVPKKVTVPKKKAKLHSSVRLGRSLHFPDSLELSEEMKTSLKSSPSGANLCLSSTDLSSNSSSLLLW